MYISWGIPFPSGFTQFTVNWDWFLKYPGQGKQESIHLGGEMLWTWQGQGQQRSEHWGRGEGLTVGGFFQFKERSMALTLMWWKTRGRGNDANDATGESTEGRAVEWVRFRRLKSDVMSNFVVFPLFSGFFHKPAPSFQVAANSKKRAQPLSTRKLY